MPSRLAMLFVVFVFAGAAVPELGAQQFGKNKVEYVDFDFKVLDTDHFGIYHYPAEETGARAVARLAERWYARLSQVLEHQLEGRQPLILYASQPEFAQTNVVNGMLGDGIGGVTESARRRIVMPFAPTLAETDRVLGHEIVHAFQFDMARRYRGGTSWPLWAIEGLAQYLALGADDPETALWLRDAVVHNLLPERAKEAAQKFSPYRYGHAMWAYMAGRFGDRVIPQILKARSAGTLPRRIKTITGFEFDELYDDWRNAAGERYGADRQARADASNYRLFSSASRGRLYLGPSVSPDGTQVAFFSERDRLSVDLFVADVATGAVRKLATTAASRRFESLQGLRSSGSWSPDGRRFVFGAVERGTASLVILKVDAADRPHVIKFPQFGQILSPSWSPDGRSIAFSAIDGGLTDIWVYGFSDGTLRRLTDDAFADLHPAWSPDGRRLAFATDRFSTDLRDLRFGPVELAIADVKSGAIERVAAVDGASHLNPQWSDDGARVYFMAGVSSASNVYSVDTASGEVFQITDEDVVAGLTGSSPALSVARRAPVVAYTVYRAGKYDIQVRRGAYALAGVRGVAAAPAVADSASAIQPSPDLVRRLLDDFKTGLPDEITDQPRAYAPDMFLEAIGPAYVSSGGSVFGTFIRGGGSLLFSDLLGERKLAVFAQAGNQLRDLAVRMQYLNRERRWNWGAIADVQPSFRRLPRMRAVNLDDNPVFTSETHHFERTQVRLAGLIAYPFDRAQRVEFEAGARHVFYRRQLSAIVRSIPDGRVLSRSLTDVAGEAPATAGDVSAAFVRDTSVHGPASPILGARSRFEVASTFGELSATRLLLDHRRYLMPVKPYTLAMRAVHLGQYGRDADDLRTLPMFLGSPYFLRGYRWGTVKCEPNERGECVGYNQLLGTRLLVGNVELRAPLLGLRSREFKYGPVPIEAFVFGDAGFAWSGAPHFSSAPGEWRLVRSFGAGVRLNAFGLPIEWALARATDRPSRGWSFGASFRPAF